MKAVTVALSVVSMMLLASLPPASAAGSGGASDSAAPLIVKITSVDGKKRLQVKKRLKVFVSCSKDCTLRANLTLKTPANNLKVTGSRQILAGQIWTTGIQMTRFGLGYLKKVYRSSVLKVAVTARDGHGKPVNKTKYFHFHR